MALAAVGLAGCAGSRGGDAASSASTSSAPSAESSSTTCADAASNPSSAAASAGGKSVIVLWSWSGKTIVPFNSHEGSGDGGTYADLREMTGVTVLDGLAIRGGDVATSLDKVDEWYATLKL